MYSITRGRLTQDWLSMMRKFETTPCRSCCKCTFIFVNVVFMITALVFIGLGLYLSFVSSVLASIYGLVSFYTFTTVTALVVGVFLLLLALSGIYSVVQEIGELLAFYAAALIIVFLLTIAGSVLGVMFKTHLIKYLKKDLVKSLEEYDPFEPYDGLKAAWDTIQSNFECCGLSLDGKTDPRKIWKRNKILNYDPSFYFLPMSCCPPVEQKKDKNKKQIIISCNVTKAWERDCLKIKLISIKKSPILIVLGGIAGIVGTLMIFGILCSIVLARIALK